jgi:hypothetical protein
MKSTKENPFEFFKHYFKEGYKNDLIGYETEKEFVREWVNDRCGEHIPLDLRTLPFEDSTHPSKEDYILRMLKDEIDLSKCFVEQGFEQRFLNKSETLSYGKFLNFKLQQILDTNKLMPFPIIIDDFIDFISPFCSLQSNDDNSPLEFYFNILFVTNIKSIRDGFLGNKELISKGYVYQEQQDYYMSNSLIEDGDTPIITIDIIDRDKFFIDMLLNANANCYKIIENKLIELEGLEDKKEFLKVVYVDLKTLLKRTLQSDDEDAIHIETKLIELLNKLKTRYFNVINYHDVFKYLFKETDATFFKCKNFKYSFYENLYEVTYSLDLIDDTEIEENDFILAFTSPNPKILEKKVRFIQNNYIVAYFLESLKPFFNGFNHTTIEKSNVFLNKQNKLLKSTDIYASLSRGKDKFEDYKIKIDIQISELKNLYLK